MTDEELTGLARQALNIAGKAWENTDYGGMVLASYHAGEGICRMEPVEKLIEAKLGQRWLDDERLKDIGYGVLREVVDMFATSSAAPDAIVMVTASNMFLPTPKFQALPIEKQKWLINSSNKDHHRLAAEGYLRVVDSRTAVVQTPERVCCCTQEVAGDRLVGQPTVKHFAQDEFSGRLKMFGEDKLEAARVKGRAN